MSNDVTRVKQSAPDESTSGIQVREGVLAVPGELKLHFGGSLDSVSIAWRLAGPAGAPVVVALGGISASRRVWTPDEPRGGWWHEVVGPGLALDPQRFRILSFDYLGASADSTGPRDGAPFPTVSAYDQAELLLRLMNHLGISSLRAIAGASYGGMVALAFAERFPEMTERVVAISAPHEPHPMSTALRTLQRRIVELGLETGRAGDALSIARGLAMTSYRTAGEFGERFRSAASPGVSPGAPRFEVDAYLRDRGARFVEAMRPERFLALSLSADLHRVDPERIATPATIVAAEGDTIVPREQLTALSERLAGPCNQVDLPSRVGHDAFLVETARVSSILSAALS